jgi:mono/diheme cytochrome c family protein
MLARIKFWLPAMGVSVAMAGNWNVPMDARNLADPVAKTDTTNQHASRLWTDHCQQCHGPVGAGDGSEQRVSYDLRSIVVKLTDGELYWKITHGVGKMPSFAGPLTDEERWLVVNHLRNLASARSTARGPTTASTR